MRHTVPVALAASQKSGRRAAAVHRPKALVTAAFDDASIARLRAMADVEYASFRDRMQLLTGPSLVSALEDREVLITEVDVVDAKALEKLPNLRVVAACRGDAVNVDVAACSAFGIPVLFAPGRNADAVADLTVAFLLNLARRLPAATKFLADPAVTAGNLAAMGKAFRGLQGYELWSKTVGLVGLGSVGRAVARRLSGFGVRLLVADPFVSADEAVLAGAQKVELDELLRESDFVSLHAAVTDATRGMVGAAQLAAMKPGAYLINTARAALLDEAALVAALDSGHIAGAALDTFAVEPPGRRPSARQARQRDPHAASRRQHERGRRAPGPDHRGRARAARARRGAAQRAESRHARGVLVDRTAPGAVCGRARRARKEIRPGRLRSPARCAGRGAGGEARRERRAAEIVANMKRLLEAFTAEMAKDARVREFSADKDVALYFVLPDVGLDLHIALREGQVAGGPRQAVGRIRRAAAHARGDPRRDVHGQGERDGSRDAGRGRVHGRRRQGDGDPAAPGRHAAAVHRRARGGRRSGRPRVDPAAGRRSAEGRRGAKPVGADDIRVDIVATTKELYEIQVITATGGNVCARIPGSRTRSGSRRASCSRATCAPRCSCGSISTACRSTRCSVPVVRVEHAHADPQEEARGEGGDPRARAVRHHAREHGAAVPADQHRGRVLRRHPARAVHHARHRRARRGRLRRDEGQLGRVHGEPRLVVAGRTCGARPTWWRSSSARRS
jgi:autoinducer 2 (AI-2) kinase